MTTFTDDLISLKYMMTRDWKHFIGKTFKVKCNYGGESHIDLIKIIEKNRQNQIVCKIVDLPPNRINQNLYLNRSHFDHLYILENYPELCI